MKVKKFLKGGKEPVGRNLAVSELEAAETIILQHVQGQVYTQEVSSLERNGGVGSGSPIKEFSPFLDDEGLIHVGGRLKHAKAMTGSKHPILIPHSHRVVTLVALGFHEVAHLGTEWVVSQIREK